MKQEYFVVVLAHSIRGRLRRIHIPHTAVYAVLALALLGCFSVFGIVASYARMAWKVANYNALRKEADNLRTRYQNLQKVVSQTNQQLASLDPRRTVLEQMLAANRVATEGDLRMRLAHLGLDHRKIAAPGGSLSGGERLKAALACVLYADPPPHLLLLDEPSNHLDLPSVQALEAMLRGYRGALVVVSHDDAFMDSLGLTDRLVATGQGWRIEPW